MMRHLLCVASAIAIASAAYVPGRAFDRFITIWLENQDYAQVEPNSHIKSLTKEGILLTQFYGLTHPSQPNYIASVGGDYFGLDHDRLVEIPQNVSTIVDLLETRGITWGGYFEGLIGPGYMGGYSTAVDGSGWDYVRKHNPFISFESINRNGSRLANIRSFVEFDRAVKAKELPQYMHLSPNMLNDGHNTTLDFSAAWAHHFLEPLLANKDFMERTLILLTYDESSTYEIPNRIVSILLGGAVPKNMKGTRDDTFYTHYSILSTLEDNWDLPNLGRYDVGANVFDLVAQQTGYTNSPPSNQASVNNSLSYGGFLNSDPAKYLELPPINIHLIGAGGKGVLESAKYIWKMVANMPTPYDGTGIVYDGGNGFENPNKPIYKAQAPGPVFTAKTVEESAAIMLKRQYVHYAAIAIGCCAVVAHTL